MSDTWILEAVGATKVRRAVEDSNRRRIRHALSIESPNALRDDELRFVADALELRVFQLLGTKQAAELRDAAKDAFHVARAVPKAGPPIAVAHQLVRLGCLAILGDRGADMRRILLDDDLPDLPVASSDWGEQVHSTILEIWLKLFRKNGWDDLEAVQAHVVKLRKEQAHFEPAYLKLAEERQDVRPAWELIVFYHLAKAAEILGTFTGQGSVDGTFDIREQLEAQFDRAIAAANRGQLIEHENLARLLARTAQTMVANSIWTVTRAVNSRVTDFVRRLASRERVQPMFEMLPPQRRTLREQGLLGGSHRSVVVSLPTSSGKTFIAVFRILQALNQFDVERGWVTYVAPTRALVNQVTVRLRRELSPLGVVVEKVSPALEVDGLEAGILTDADASRQFRVLVTTPEKLDLMLRGGWEAKVQRPLTLVVVDEAHGLASDTRGLKLELLLATINRECRNAQFLLLTPFVPNATEIARWLDPENHQSIELGVDWSPNDRVIAIARPVRGQKRGDFSVRLSTQHTTHPSLEVPEDLALKANRPLGLAWSAVSRLPGKLAAAVAQSLQKRGTVIVLVTQPSHSWGVAKTLMVPENLIERDSDSSHIEQFLLEEMGEHFPLSELLRYGIAVHHSGLSEDTRALVEWLTSRNRLRFLVATTTIAQGVNFPVSGVVFASHQYPYGADMPHEDFWNIVGRAGRVDQGDLGMIALAAPDEIKAAALEKYLGSAVGNLNSTLVKMVLGVVDVGKLLELETLAWLPGWSTFVQYLAHTYRQIGNHERFAAQVEQVLRGTLGFQALREQDRGRADALVQGVWNYAQRLKGKPLKLVDATGFSWESVSATLGRLSAERITSEIWSPELFGARQDNLRRLMGVLLDVPELRDNLREVTGGERPDGRLLTDIICDWVQGRPLTEMAPKYFGAADPGDDETGADSVSAMTRCCKKIFGKLTQTASWGLAALQSMTIGDAFDDLPPETQRNLRNLPAWVYYGVNSNEAIALRLLGVPRSAAQPLATSLGVTADEPLHVVRGRLRASNAAVWADALGARAEAYRRVWSIIEGDA